MALNIVTWDLGATKCTAGLIEYNQTTQALTCRKKTTVKLVDAVSLSNLINQLESNLEIAMSDADAICIGAAGHYDGQSLLHANPYPYPMHFAHIASKQKWPSFAVIHDYAPIVCATFTEYMAQMKNIKRLNNCAIQTHGRRVSLGIGTGLGLKDGVLLSNGDFWLGENEAGHIGINMPPDASPYHRNRHREIMHFLQKKTSGKNRAAITFENILTGSGTVNLYQFFYADAKDITPEAVGKKMREGEAEEVMDTFAWYIGLFIGTVQLFFMPEGGIWITGGVIINHLDVFDRPDLTAGMHASPAYLAQRNTYPLGVLCNPEHALIGAAYYAVKRLLITEVNPPASSVTRLTLQNGIF